MDHARAVLEIAGGADHDGLAVAARLQWRERLKRAGGEGAYFVEVTVRKELKDYPTPFGPAVPVPVFGDVSTVDRDAFLIVEPDITSPLASPFDRWIPKGRETAIEQAILQKLQRCP